jgi:hypothetical protein
MVSGPSSPHPAAATTMPGPTATATSSGGIRMGTVRFAARVADVVVVVAPPTTTTKSAASSQDDEDPTPPPLSPNVSSVTIMHPSDASTDGRTNPVAGRNLRHSGRAANVGVLGGSAIAAAVAAVVALPPPRPPAVVVVVLVAFPTR